MHLAIVTPYPPAVTGIGQYGYHLSRSITRSGLFERITILAGKPAPTSRGGQTQSVPAPPSPSCAAPPSLTVDYAWRPDRAETGIVILSRLLSLKPDLVWFNLGASVFGRSPLANVSGLLSPAVSRKLGFPTLVTLHELIELVDLRALNAPGGPLAGAGARLLTRIAVEADVICLTTRRYVDWLSARRPGQRCVYIPIGAYHPPEILPQASSPSLLFFTTLAPFKGLELLFEAYRALLPDHPGLRLLVAGAEHSRFPGYARRLQRYYGALPGVEWLGQVKEEQVRDLFLQAQIVVLPYTASTGSSSVLYQAAMWGRPVVASDLLETRSTAAESGLEATYFKSGDPASLCAAIRYMLADPGLRRLQAAHNFAAIQRSRPEETCRLYLQAFNLTLEMHDSPKRINIPAGFTLESA